jgi:hypothetical protein
LGHRYQKGGNWIRKDAGLYDGPAIIGGNNSGREFETAALALDGNQEGTYYGSVKWGWTKDGSGTVSKVDFDIVSMGVPSKNFLGAAAKWNSAKARGKITPKANGTKIYDGSLSEQQFTFDTGMEATQKKTVSLGNISYLFVEITSEGTHKGKTGYVKVADAKDDGSGVATVDLPIVDVKIISSDTSLFTDSSRTKKLTALAKGARVKILDDTQDDMKKIEVVDGSSIGTQGWVSAGKLVDES